MDDVKTPLTAEQVRARLMKLGRGLSREILSIASWAAAAAAAFFFYPLVLPYVQPYIDNEQIAMVAAAGVVFVVALIIVTLITMKIADWIIDSRIGALDRTLGFLYGAARGIFSGRMADGIAPACPPLKRRRPGGRLPLPDPAHTDKGRPKQ